MDRFFCSFAGMRKLMILTFLFLMQISLQAQVAYKPVLKENRDKYNQYLLNKSIIENLNLPLTETTEENWETAFWTITFIQYKNELVEKKVDEGFKNIQQRSTSFQRALLELIYTEYPNSYNTEVANLLRSTNNDKVFAMCAEYILNSNYYSAEKALLLSSTNQRLAKNPTQPILISVLNKILYKSTDSKTPPIEDLLQKDFLKGNVVVFSFQRKNRNFPGLVMVRNGNGNFVRLADSSFFNGPQLARSASNMSGYLTNGNTPEGILRMDGWGISKSNVLGPTTNIQLTMPAEYSAKHFYQDSTLIDSIWDVDQYKRLLPSTFKNYFPILESFYAGKAGRTEIIAHGTAVDPSYYLNHPYYPISPTQGCLCSKEIWDERTGLLIESDQLKLVNAITSAGGPKGYYIVININSEERPVELNDILPYLKKATQN